MLMGFLNTKKLSAILWQIITLLLKKVTRKRYLPCCVFVSLVPKLKHIVYILLHLVLFMIIHD